MNKPILIFDFDGTIADSMKYILEVANDLSKTYKFKKLTVSEIESMRRYNIQKMLKRIGIPLYKELFFIRAVRKKIAENIHKIEMFPGIKEVLLKLKAEGYSLSMITNDSKETAEKFLKMHDLQIFDYIYGETITSLIFGKSILINKFVRNTGFLKQNIYYVADEVSDITAARKSGIKIIAVSWGYSAYDELKKYNPDFIAQTPRDILSIAREL